MQHSKEEIQFHGVECLSQLQYDVLLAALPNKAEDLKKFVRTHYELYHKIAELKDDFRLLYNLYQSMIDMSIKNNNLIGLEILWQGIYFHDRDNPDYLHDVYVASEYSDLKTFQHVLYAYLNYRTLNCQDPINVNKLKLLAISNAPVLKFINHIVDVDEDIIEPMSMPSNSSDSDSDSDLDVEDARFEQKVKQFYNKISTFVP